MAWSKRPAIPQDRAAIHRKHATKTLEQRRLARSVRTDQSEDFPFADGERHIVERSQPSVPLGEIDCLDQTLVACPRHLYSRFRAGHPGWLRCSFVGYSRHPRSSRLAIRAPRSEIRRTTDADRPLVLSSARPLLPT